MMQTQIKKLKMGPAFVFQKSKSFICLIFIYIKSFHPPAGGPFF